MERQKDILQKKLEAFFSVEQQTAKEILNQLCLYVYAQNAKETDLYHLAKILPDKYLNDVVDYYDGAVVKFPTKQQFHDSLLLAICFFLHEIEGYGWDDIRRILHIPKNSELFSSVSLGKKLSGIKYEMYDQLKEALYDLSMEDIAKIFEKEFHEKMGEAKKDE